MFDNYNKIEKSKILNRNKLFLKRKKQNIFNETKTNILCRMLVFLLKG